MSEREDRAKALALASGGPDWEDMRAVERDVFRRQAEREGFASEVGHEVGNAAAEVTGQCQDRFDDISALLTVADGGIDLLTETAIENLEIGAEYDDHELQNESHVIDAALDRLHELPLSVERTVAFEVVLGTGGPDDRLVFECVDGSGNGPEGPQSYEVRRVLYRYSWTGSAEIELTGDDREAAERFGAMVVPELEGAF